MKFNHPKEGTNTMKKTLLATVALCAATLLAAFDEYHVKSSLQGTLVDWTSGDTYEEGLPSDFSNAKVYLGVKVLVNSTTISGLSAIKYLNLMNFAGEVEITVAEGVTNDVACAIAAGMIRKKGAGCLRLNSPGGVHSTSTTINYDYHSKLYVEAGDVILPQDIGSRKQVFLHYLSVDEGATCVITKNKETWISGDGRMVGGGTITALSSASAGETRIMPQFSGTPQFEFAGRIDGKLRLYTCANIYLSNTNSTMEGSPILYSGSASKYVKVPMIGMTGHPSPLGINGTVSLQEHGAYLRYIGKGELTDKNFSVNHSTPTTNAVQSVMDGGPHGGLVLAGQLAASNGSRVNQMLELSGSNEVACAVVGAIPIVTKSADAQGGPYTNRLHISKTGTGTWRMGYNASRDGVCGVTVKEGTLLFDVLADVGEQSSFGTGMVLGETSFCSNDCAIYRPNERVPYAFTLGSASDGTIGTMALASSATGCVCTTRPFAISGTGRLLNDTTARMAVGGVAPLPGAGQATLVLDGSSLAENAVADVSNGVDTTLSVVKRGLGRWRLSGAQTFSGDLDVQGGELVVENHPAGRTFTRFRVVFKENFGATNNCAVVDAWAKNVFVLRGLALYDSEGNNHNTCTNFVADYTTLDEESVAYADSARRDLLYRKTNGVAPGSQPSVLAAGGMWCAGLARPYLNKPETWVKLDFRVKEGVTVAAIDFRPYFGYDPVGSAAANPGTRKWNFGANPEIFTVYGSVDGMFWEPLFDEDVHTECAGFVPDAWYYGNGYSEGVAKGLAFRRTVSSRGGFDVLTNVRNVSVSGGATLRAEGGPVTLSSLALDAASGGTISNFTFAANGSLSVTNVPSAYSGALPYAFQNVTGLENLSNWSLAMPGGRAYLYSVATGNGTVHLVKHGFRMIVR